MDDNATQDGPATVATVLLYFEQAKHYSDSGFELCCEEFKVLRERIEAMERLELKQELGFLCGAIVGLREEVRLLRERVEQLDLGNSE